MKTLAQLDTWFSEQAAARKPLTFQLMSEEERADFYHYFADGKPFTPEEMELRAKYWLVFPNQQVIDNCNDALPPHIRIAPATTTDGRLVGSIDLLSDAATLGGAASILRTLKVVQLSPADFPAPEEIT